MADERPVLVLGSTGYVGGRLVPLLLERGHRVRAAGRSVDKIMARPWGATPTSRPCRRTCMIPPLSVAPLWDAVLLFIWFTP